MYRNFNANALGVSGRQSELLEIALTYRFKGIDVDVSDLVKRAKMSTVENACKYLVSAVGSSAKLLIGGFEVPVRWRGTEAEFQADINDLGVAAEVCKAIGATLAHTTVLASSKDKALPDNFKFHTERLTALGNALEKINVRLAIGFQAAAEFRPESEYQFLHQANGILELLSSIQSSNVGLLLDTWNWHVGGGKLEQVKNLKDRLFSVRLADVAADADLTQITATERLLPGEGGAVDIPSYLSTLSQMEFAGPVSPYPHPSQFLGRTRESNVQRAAQALDQMWIAAGMALPPPPTPSSASSMIDERNLGGY